MSLLQAIVLGLVQGITEFLPISSTAHLRIIPALLGWADPGAFYSSFIQLGTVAAVILYFWRELIAVARGMIQGLKERAPIKTVEARLGWFVILGTFPVAIVGLLFKKHIETTLRSLYVISASMVALAVVLFIVERLAKHRRNMLELTARDALIVGCCQAVALIPGSSRSGTTLTGGLALGFKREDAARFSFLLSIPANVAAAVLEFKHHIHDADRPSDLMLAVGTAVAFGSGMAVIAGLLRFLRTRTTLVFVAYRLVLGVALFTMLKTGRLSPQTGLEGDRGTPAEGALTEPSQP